MKLLLISFLVKLCVQIAFLFNFHQCAIKEFLPLFRACKIFGNTWWK